MGRFAGRLLWLVIRTVVAWYKYIVDARREANGLPPKYPQSEVRLCENSSMTEMPFEILRSQIEANKMAEEEKLRKQRSTYVYDDTGVKMDEIEAKGVIAPRVDEENKYMSDVTADGAAASCETDMDSF